MRHRKRTGSLRTLCHVARSDRPRKRGRNQSEMILSSRIDRDSSEMTIVGRKGARTREKREGFRIVGQGKSLDTSGDQSGAAKRLGEMKVPGRRLYRRNWIPGAGTGSTGSIGLTGMRTVLIPVSASQAQSLSTIQFRQWSCRISRACVPRATSRSLCPGGWASRNGRSAIHLSNTNHEPGRS